MFGPPIGNKGPHAPADAYKLVESLLPAEFFLEVPAVAGARLDVTGRDGLKTEWALPTATAMAIVSCLRSRRDCRMTITHYDWRGPVL